MTERLVATIDCNGCDAQIVIDESNLAARHAVQFAGDRGWSWDTEGNNWCPGCTERRRKEKKPKRRTTPVVR